MCLTLSSARVKNDTEKEGGIERERQKERLDILIPEGKKILRCRELMAASRSRSSLRRFLSAAARLLSSLSSSFSRYQKICDRSLQIYHFIKLSTAAAVT